MTTPPTDAELAEWTRLTATATMPPWDVSARFDDDGPTFRVQVQDHPELAVCKTYGNSYGASLDAQFIAASREAMPRLLALARSRETAEADAKRIAELERERDEARVERDENRCLYADILALAQENKDAAQREWERAEAAEARLAELTAPLGDMETTGEQRDHMRFEAKAEGYYDAETSQEMAALLRDFDRQEAELRRLRAEKASTRDVALEQAAKIVQGRTVQERYFEWPEWGPGNRGTDSELVSLTRVLAAAIRSMKGAPDA